jgi:UDP-N-acetylmuramate--alanine ligase
MDDFQQAFNDADMVFISPVYHAGETPIDGVDSDALVNGIKARGHRSAATVTDAADLAVKLAEVLQDRDMVVCLGAGDITKWAAGLADAIKAARA